MKTRQVLFRATAILIFLQIALGGLLTFNFITPLPHIITGFIVLGFAIATAIVAISARPRFRPLLGLSTGLVVLVIVQIILGFATLGTGSEVVAWVHLVNAVAIYGMTVAGIFMAMREDFIERGTGAS